LWYLEAPKELGIGDSILVLGRVAGVLEKHGLLKSDVIEVCWSEYGKGKIGIWTRVAPGVPFTDPRYTILVQQSRPSGFPGAHAAHIDTVSTGTWIDASGSRHQERQLVNLTVSPEPGEIQVEVSVHHDIWSWYDFSGNPHPEIYDQNAPRLAAALEEIEKTLQTETENGEGTYFGVSEGFWIKRPDPEDLVDGLAMDSTDRL
jgi:predicted DNA-binding transcriptional regulator